VTEHLRWGWSEGQAAERGIPRTATKRFSPFKKKSVLYEAANVHTKDYMFLK
jgi:hypothetical protein